MPQQLTENDARESLTAHVAAKGAEVHEKYGPHIGWSELLLILLDRSCVRYPCEILFDAAALERGEFAFPATKGDSPEDGFTIHVHPLFSLQLDRVPYLVLYQLVLVNYGPFASADDAEIFGSSALGLSREEYYKALCEMADQIEGCS
jgi:hypothetical protein